MLLRNTTTNVAGLAISLVLAFATTALLARNLGPVAFGLLALVRAIVGNAGLLETLFGSGVTRYVAVSHTQGDVAGRDRYAAAGLVVNLAQGIVLSGLLLLAAIVLFDDVFPDIPADMRPEGRTLLYIFFLVFVLQICSTTLSRVIEGLQEYPAIRVSEVAIQGLLIAALVMFFRSKASGVLHMIGWVYVAVESARLGLYAVVLKRYGIAPKLQFAFHRKTIRELFEYGRPLFVAKLFTTLGYRGDALILGVFVSLRAVANYGVANQVWSAGLAGLSALTAALLPAMAERHARKSQDLARLFLRASRYALTAALVGAALVIFLGRVVVERWVGAEYTSAPLLITLFMVQVIVAYHQGVSNMVALGAMTYRPIAKYEAIGSTCNLILSLALVRRYGAAGVIVAGIIKTAFIVPVYVAIALRTTELSWSTYIRTCIMPVWRLAGAIVLAGIVVKGLGALVGTSVLVTALMQVAAVLVIGSPLVWLFILEPGDRKRLLRAVPLGLG